MSIQDASASIPTPANSAPETPAFETHVPDNQQKSYQFRAIKPEKQGFFARLLGGKRAGAHDQRAACCVVAVMLLVDRALPLDGMIMELGQGTLLFRPASTFILDRNGAEVSLRFGRHEMRGRIIHVSPRGYLVTMAGTLSQDDLEETLSKFGLGDAVTGFANHG
jgi:hypothetical protein